MSRISLLQENTFEFEGVKLNYRVAGTGEPVILLHGSMVSDPWNGFERMLGKYFRVYLPELPGFGASEAIPGKVHDTALFSRAFAAFVNFSGLKSVPVVAFSLGAIVAIKASVSGATAGKLVLVGLPISLESRLLPRILGMPIEMRRKLAENELARGGILLSILKEIIGTADKQFVFKYLSLLRTSDVRAMVDADLQTEVPEVIEHDLPKLNKNTVFIYGERDKLRMAAEKVLSGRLRTVPRAGHDVFVSRPRETLRMLREVLEVKKTWRQKLAGLGRKIFGFGFE